MYYFDFFHADRHINKKETKGKPFVVRCIILKACKNDQDEKWEKPTFVKASSLAFDEI